MWRNEWADYAELLKAATTPDGNRWEYGHDEHGNLTEVRDPLGNSTFTTWHPVFAFPLKEMLPDGGTWQYEYNARGDVVSLTDPKGGVMRFEWNERGQLVRDEDCSGNQSYRLYYAAGRRTRLRLRARPLHREISHRQGVLSQETHYDTLEQGTKAIEPQKEERFLRDAAGNRTEEHRNPVWHNLLLPGPLPDRESGIHYNLFRYYDTVAGRYTQMDLIGLAGGLNIYSYVGDPLVWVDVLGLMCTLTIPKAKWGERINFLLRKWTCLSKV